MTTHFDTFKDFKESKVLITIASRENNFKSLM